MPSAPPAADAYEVVTETVHIQGLLTADGAIFNASAAALMLPRCIASNRKTIRASLICSFMSVAFVFWKLEHSSLVVVID